MSLDLYQDALLENAGALRPTTEAEPGVFDGFFRGAGMTAMRGFAQTARTMGMVGGVVPLMLDNPVSNITGSSSSTTLSDAYFRKVDETLGSAVDYWTPKPNEVGVAGQVVGSLLSILPQAMVSAPLAAASAADIGAELVGKGVPAGEAAGVAGIMAAGMAAGVWMPILGTNLWQRTLLGGAAFNVAQGIASRAGAETILQGRHEAKQFEALGPTELTLDLILGLAFGGFAHLVPAQREQGRAAWRAIGEWAQGLTPTEVAATATLRTAQHLNTDSTPGLPVDVQDIDTHVQRMRQAIDQLVRGDPVNVADVKPVVHQEGENIIPENIPPEVKAVAEQADGVRAAGDPAFVLDPAKQVERAQNAATLMAAADAVRREEGIPRVADTPLLVPNDITQLAPDLQAQHIGELVSNRLLELDLPPEQAQAHGAIWSAFFKTAAERYGVAPSDLLAKYGVDVRRMSALEQLPGALEQAGRLAPAAEVAQSRNLEDAYTRQQLQFMADNEAGWLSVGGRLDIARLVKEYGEDALDQFGRPTKLGVVAFTEWIPKAEWWTSRPGHPGRGLNEAKVQEAVRKALAGEPLKKLEQATVDHMVDVLNKRLDAERQLGEDRWNEVAEEVVQAELEPTKDNVVDADQVARAQAIDEDAVERAAMQHQDDDAAFMAAIRRINGEEKAGSGGEAGEGRKGTDPSRTIPADLQPGETLYHGTRSTIDELKGIVYLTNDPREAGSFARGEIPGTGRAAQDASPTVVEVAPQGHLQVKNVDSIIQDGVMNDGDVDVMVRDELAKATAEGYGAISFTHPGIHTDEFVVIVPTHPAEWDIGAKGDANNRTLYQADEPRTWYYSALARALDAAQIKSAPAKGWKDYLKSLPQKGVKAEEIRWSGLEEWLDLQPGKVTKEQVADFLKKGGVRVEEVMLGGNNAPTPQDAVIARDTALLEQHGMILDQDPAALAGDEGGARWGVIDPEGDIYAFPGDANELRASIYRPDPPPPGAEATQGIPDNVVDAIDRVLGYLNRGEMPAPPPPVPGVPSHRWEVYDMRDNAVVETFATEEQAQANAAARGDLFRVVRRPEGWDVAETAIATSKIGIQPSFDITPEMRKKAMEGQPLFQRAPEAQQPHGAITLGEGKTVIALFETADASTFAHESGHLFLEMTKDLASRDGVPPEAVQDWATLASWLGIDGGEIPRAAHEKFARGWEQYLSEGVAPNESLKGVFQRFRDWLLEVYNRLLGRGLEVELTDEVRGVMARMLDSQARDPSPVQAQTTQAAAQAPAAAPTASAAPGAEGAPPSEPPPTQGGASEPRGPADTTPPDHVANEAMRIATERPDLRIRTGTDAEGGAIYSTAADFIASAKAEAQAAREDVRLIEAAAECLLGTV